MAEVSVGEALEASRPGPAGLYSPTVETRCPAFHHTSHRRLITAATVSPSHDATVDAIIVPTARPAAYMRNALGVAAKLNCTLVALCSKYASAAATATLAKEYHIQPVALDLGELPPSLLPHFETDELLAQTNNRRFARNSDLSRKRNIALVLARTAGWKRIAFLDDDIEVPTPRDLCDAASLLDEYAGVGLTVDGFPDNSVVCHAYRHVGGLQDTFVGGGALAVPSAIVTSFFPNTYNDDWLYLLEEDGLRRTALTNGRVIQWPYDPFASDRRARAEEFGECIAEGLYWLLDQDGSVTDANLNHWTEFLNRRRSFIDHIIREIAALPTGNQECEERNQRMVAALQGARGRCLAIEPALCVEYVSAWRRDRDTWRKHVKRLRRRIPSNVRRLIDKASGVGRDGPVAEVAPISASPTRGTSTRVAHTPMTGP